MDDIRPNKEIKKEIKPVVIEWQAPAFKYYPKDVSWYWLSFIIAILFMAFAILQKNFLFAVFIFLAEISVLILARRQPETLKFKIDDKGVTVIDKTYPFGDLETFCLRLDDEDKNFEELILKRKTHFNPYLKIFVDIKAASRIHDILGQKLAEEEYQDSLIEIIFKWLRF
ncbi:MAG: hypothetical protein WC475_02135 [Candidatus Paceibacterota bacterium]|jgi:hypothetical protein